MYSFESRIRYSEVDENGTLSLMGIMNYLQDCSTFQSEDSGCGVAWLKAHDRAWLLSAWKISIFRRPYLGEHAVISTKPYCFEGALGWRLFEIRTREGECLVSANSVWCYVQPSKGRPVRLTPEDVLPYSPIDTVEETMTERKIRVVGEPSAAEPFAVRREHLDTNHHVNNGQYISMALEYLPEGFTVRGIQAEYRAQAHRHDRIVPMISKAGDTVYVTLGDGEQKIFAIVAFS